MARISVIRLASSSGFPGDLDWAPLSGFSTSVETSAAVASDSEGEITAPRSDGDSITAEDAAKSSRGGGSHNSALEKGAVDGADKTTVKRGVTVMSEVFWHCLISAFEQHCQTTMLARLALGMAETDHSKTWVRAEVVLARDCSEEKKHMDV
ncbi:hypothetical protein ASZ78_016229 [Callipepla squamata]|uniref:Uncharacterized protein n=1 Tax=Callipepla squamata TaxID=9009 RepID=A0A226M9A2_CALSU|nr:hypothetical protein ASZ78_016229 [Callipepla squamata]